MERVKMYSFSRTAFICLFVCGCLSSSDKDTSSNNEEELDCTTPQYNHNPFIKSVVSYMPGNDAGFGQESMPDILLGPPLGGGENSGSLDVVSLGEGGEIVLGFEIPIIDGEGADFIVFENPFVGWLETGIVSVSDDGEIWHSWTCEAENVEDNYPGCAGVTPTLSHPANCLDATDPMVSGGDDFDLADIGLSIVQFVRIQDSGFNPDNGFDLDAISIIHYDGQ
jgi:hypothetical protein